MPRSSVTVAVTVTVETGGHPVGELAGVVVKELGNMVLAVRSWTRDLDV